MELGDLAKYIVDYLRNHAPGLYEFLNVLCQEKRGKKLMDLLLENPPQLYQLLVEHYGDEFTATFAFTVLVKPILIRLGALGGEHEVVERAKRDPNVFKDLLKRYRASSKR